MQYLTTTFIIACTGCRPSEAAYIAINKSIQPNSYQHYNATYMGIAEDMTKTRRVYKWPLHNKYNAVWKNIS
jgi:hypothetical protein